MQKKDKKQLTMFNKKDSGHPAKMISIQLEIGAKYKAERRILSTSVVTGSQGD